MISFDVEKLFSTIIKIEKGLKTSKKIVKITKRKEILNERERLKNVEPKCVAD